MMHKQKGELAVGQFLGATDKHTLVARHMRIRGQGNVTLTENTFAGPRVIELNHEEMEKLIVYYQQKEREIPAFQQYSARQGE